MSQAHYYNYTAYYILPLRAWALRSTTLDLSDLDPYSHLIVRIILTRVLLLKR